MNKLPHPLCARFERWLIYNKVWIWLAIGFFVFFVLPFLLDGEPLDSVLVDGIGGFE